MNLWSGTKLNYRGGRESEPHVHPFLQVFFIESGLLNIRTARGSWVVPPGRLGCIKGDVSHSAFTLSPLKAWSVFCPVPEKVTEEGDIYILKSSPLLRTLIERVTEKGQLDLTNETDKNIAGLISSEMASAVSEPLGLPLPRSKSLLKVAEKVLSEGPENNTVSNCARLAAMSVRSFSRHFRAETGLTFERWRTIAAHQKAIELLTAGENVTSAALTLGYDSVSAFIASFKRQHGSSPTKFLKS